MTQPHSRFVLACILSLLIPLNALAEPIEKLDPNFAAKAPEGNLLWYDALALGLEGQGWSENAKPFDRLPAKAEGVVRGAVWSLSRHSAGQAVRFLSDANAISARWKVTNKNLAMAHMPATGVSGLDLYVNDNGTWRWIGAGRPSAQTNEAQLAGGIPEGTHEYLIYLPLYNGTEEISIGIAPDAILAKAPARTVKPIVVYGTSIVHGGCASRPGMAYPAILGRWLHHPTINLGFSGNGKMDMELADLLAEIDASVYVLDTAPNMNPEMIAERLVPFVEKLRAAKPDTPIVLVENIAYQQGAFLPKSKASYVDKNIQVKKGYETLTAKNIPGLYYIEGETLLGTDGEGAVDGTHPTDLGFMRMAEGIAPTLKQALKLD